MGGLLLIIIAIVLAVEGKYTLLWIAGGVFLLAAAVSPFAKKQERTVPQERPRTRIDIPHFYESDEHACTICGTWFHTNTMTCPHCGVRFNHTVTDDRAFIEEEDFEDWMDEMDEAEGR